MNRDETLAELEVIAERLARPDFRKLVLADRCDQCPNGCAQAFVRVAKIIDGKEYELLFCGHHFARYEPELIAGGWMIQDERNKINAKPMSGSNFEE